MTDDIFLAKKEKSCEEFEDSLLILLDHPIHPPSMDGDPFKIDFQEDLGCHLKFVDGVCHVYKDGESLERGEPVDFPYPELPSFLKDQSLMFAFISDGPL